MRLCCTRAGPDGWAIKSNFAGLNSGRVFRLDWFIIFYQLVVSMLIVIATVSRVLPQVLAPSHLKSSTAGVSHANLGHFAEIEDLNTV